MIIFLISQKKKTTYSVTPYLKLLIETVQMRGHIICFYAELTKKYLIITKYSLLSRALPPCISVSQVLGKEGQGVYVLMSGLDIERGVVASMPVG